MAAASAPEMLRPNTNRSSARAGPISSGSRHEAAGANTPSLISGWPSFASGAAKMRWLASASSSPPPRHCPRTAVRIVTGDATIRRTRWVKLREHRRDLIGQMLPDRRAVAEMLALGVDQHARQPRMIEMRHQRGIERRRHLAVDEVGFRPVEAQPQQCTLPL